MKKKSKRYKTLLKSVVKDKKLNSKEILEIVKKISNTKFDKSVDDRCTKNKWVKVKKKPNIVIFEGWCVGATAHNKCQTICA